jgi:DNA-binding cell septation regulator SpoVG
MNVEVIEIRLLNNGKPLKAFADIRVGNWIIRDFRVVQHNGGRAYVETPLRSWRDSNGVIQFKNILTLPKDLKWQIESAILAEYQKAREKENEESASD